MILKICNEDQNDWDIFLPELLFSYRTLVHKTNKQTPFSVMFGRPFSGIEQPSIDLNNNNESDYEGGLKFITYLRESVISTVKNNVTESQEKQKKQYAKKRKVDSKSDKIKKGDKVLLFNARKSSRKGSKMEKSWKGPYEVHDISDKGVATLTQLDGILLNTKCNIKHLKKYVERDANEIEVTKVSNEYTCIHTVDIKWQQDVLSKCKVPLQLKNCHPEVQRRDVESSSKPSGIVKMKGDGNCFLFEGLVTHWLEIKNSSKKQGT